MIAPLKVHKIRAIARTKYMDIETVGGRAGMSLWTGEELRRFPFLHVD